jgi:hypothetical protein
MSKEKIELDAATKAWFDKRPSWERTTVAKCEKCGLWYKPSLGHKCEQQK